MNILIYAAVYTLKAGIVFAAAFLIGAVAFRRFL